MWGPPGGKELRGVLSPIGWCWGAERCTRCPIIMGGDPNLTGDLRVGAKLGVRPHPNTLCWV